MYELPVSLRNSFFLRSTWVGKLTIHGIDVQMLYDKSTFIPRSEGILCQHSNRQHTQRAAIASVDLISKKFSTSESSDQIYSLSSPVHLDFVGQYVQRTDLNFSVISRLRSCF